jgi:hypothetical protein
MSEDRTELEKQINALSCARQVLAGNGGGYSPDERARAVTTLNAMYDRAVKVWQTAASNDATG